MNRSLITNCIACTQSRGKSERVAVVFPDIYAASNMRRLAPHQAKERVTIYPSKCEYFSPCLIRLYKGPVIDTGAIKFND